MGNTAGELLLASDVLTEREGAVSLSRPFESSVAEYRATVADRSREELTDLLAEQVGEGTPVEPLVGLAEKDPRVVAELLALYDHLDASGDADPLALFPVLRLFRSEPVPTDGVPEPFVPIPGDQLSEFSELYSHVLAYVWLDDCEPCDAMKSRLESVFDRPRDVMLFAVYGPDYKEALAREYDVTAGPAVLFLRNGAVDARLYGDHGEAVIETELEKLLEAPRRT